MPAQANISGVDIIINDCDRTPCEVWSRCMGYFRPVNDWNIGKRQEHKERKWYRISPVLNQHLFPENSV